MARQNKSDVVYQYIQVAEKEISKRWHEPTVVDILRHLTERGVVDPKRLRNYMIIYDFDTLLKFNDGSRTHTFMDLSRLRALFIRRGLKKEQTTILHIKVYSKNCVRLSYC